MDCMILFSICMSNEEKKEVSSFCNLIHHHLLHNSFPLKAKLSLFSEYNILLLLSKWIFFNYNFYLVIFLYINDSDFIVFILYLASFLKHYKFCEFLYLFLLILQLYIYINLWSNYIIIIITHLISLGLFKRSFNQTMFSLKLFLSASQFFSWGSSEYFVNKFSRLVLLINKKLFKFGVLINSSILFIIFAVFDFIGR